MKVKQRVFEIIQDAKPGDKVSKIFDVTLIVLIVINVGMVIAETFNIPQTVSKIFYYIETVSVIIFTIFSGIYKGYVSFDIDIFLPPVIAS